MMTRGINEMITMRQVKPRRVLAISNRGTKIWSTKVHDPGEIICDSWTMVGDEMRKSMDIARQEIYGK
jgi:hypothetical protein